MTDEIDDMPDVIFSQFNVDYPNALEASFDIKYSSDTEYTKTSTVNKQIVEALDKVEDAVGILYSAGHLNKFTIEKILNEIKKQYEASGE